MKKGRLYTLLFVFAFACTTVLTGLSVLKISASIAPDFQVFYGAAGDLFHKKNPYADTTLFTAFNYPPQTAVIFLSLLLFPYRIAQAIFTIGNFLLVPAIVFLSLRVSQKKVEIRSFLLFTSLAYLFFPTKFTLGMGQSNLLALLLFLLSVFLFQGKRLVAAGVVLGFAFIAKPILLFAGLFYLFRKQWKILFVSLVTILFISVLLLPFFDMSIYGYYLFNHLPSLTSENGLGVYYNQSVFGFAARATENPLVRQLIRSFFLVVIIWGTIFQSLRKETNDALFLSRLFIALLLINIISWQHHFVLLLFPFIVLSTYFWKRRQLVGLVRTVVAFLLVGANIKDPSLFTVFPQNLVLSHVFFGAALLFLISLTLPSGEYLKQRALRRQDSSRS